MLPCSTNKKLKLTLILVMKMKIKLGLGTQKEYNCKKLILGMGNFRAAGRLGLGKGVEASN